MATDADSQSRPADLVPEEGVEASSAIGMGYTESKWIAEEILLRVSEQANIRTTSVRLGQVCGDQLGHWNEKEWFPALVKSSLSTRCLPRDMHEVCISKQTYQVVLTSLGLAK